MPKSNLAPKTFGCYKSAWLSVLLLFVFTGGVRAASMQEPVIHKNHLTDSIAERLKDSLKVELLHAKMNDPVTERKYLTSILQDEQSNTAVKSKKHGQKFYYKLALAFTKLRLYSLAMKCYFKTLTIEDKMDTVQYAPLVTASVDGRTLLADNIRCRMDSLTVADSITSTVMNIHSADIKLVNRDSVAYNGDAEIRSPLMSASEILDPFDDGKKAAAYAIMIHVRQPVSGKRKIYVLNNVGHTFVTLIKYNTDSTIVTRSFGFYPKKDSPLAATPLFPSSPSTFKNDSLHSWDEISGTFISRKRFNRMLTIIQKYEHKKYQLSHTNCTDFGLEMAAEAGIFVNDTQGKWPLGHGNNPACFGQSILEGKITASNDTYNGKLLIVDDLVNTKSAMHYHK